MILQKKKIIIIMFIFLLSAIFLGSSSFVYAEELEYSGVMADLSKDSSFAYYRYPQINNDYSLQLIQIAEGDKKELYVYVYQPSGQAGNLRASSINISHNAKGEVQPYNYKLTYCNSERTLFKYRVDGFSLLDIDKRQVDVYSIYRPFIKNIDKVNEGQSVSEVSFNVSKTYQFATIDGKYVVRCDKIDTCTITDKFVGFVRYKDGFKFNPSACDSHFVAFNTNLSIDQILQARLTFVVQGVVHHFKVFSNDTYDYWSAVNKESEVNAEKVTYVGTGIGGNTYKWDRISKTNGFLTEFNVKEQLYSGALINVVAKNNLSKEALSQLNNKEWVLRFYETKYTDYADGLDPREEFTQVGDVSILEFTYVYQDNVYNVGVIDNKQSGSNKPIGSGGDIGIELTEKGKLLLTIIAVILLLIVLLPILPYIIQFIVWIISLPFKLLTSIFIGFGKLSQRSNEKPGKFRSNVVHVDEKNITKKGKYKR